MFCTNCTGAPVDKLDPDEQHGLAVWFAVSSFETAYTPGCIDPAYFLAKAGRYLTGVTAVDLGVSNEQFEILRTLALKAADLK